MIPTEEYKERAIKTWKIAESAVHPETVGGMVIASAIFALGAVFSRMVDILEEEKKARGPR